MVHASFFIHRLSPPRKAVAFTFVLLLTSTIVVARDLREKRTLQVCTIHPHFCSFSKFKTSFIRSMTSVSLNRFLQPLGMRSGIQAAYPDSITIGPIADDVSLQDEL